VYAVNYNVFSFKDTKSDSTKAIASKSSRFATLSNCGKLLKTLATILVMKVSRRSQLTADPDGNNAKVWTIVSNRTIRIQDPKDLKQSMDKVQRLNVSGGINIPLRYSLVPEYLLIKYIERWGTNEELWQA
jgi:hypothetical protein